MVYRKPSVSQSGDSYSRVSVSSNIGPTTSGNVKVCVRVRPENPAEAESGRLSVIRILDEHVLIFDPKEESSPDFFRGKRRVGRDLNKKKKRDVRFAFDRVFDQAASNQDVYDQTTSLVLDGLLDGYNCSVFAYGATGAGKTFTMLGNYQSPGVVFLTMMDLYKRIESLKEEKTCDVAVSYLEVYNEQIRDLLVPGNFLPIREDSQKGVVITGLSLHKPSSAEELLHMLDYGNRNRTQHPTDANAESSRSHAVFQVFVRQKDRTANISANVRVAKMSLIDLAGSERATVTTNRGARFREGANINKSLLALGNCINALAEGKSKGYVPYRNSKLTRLLKDSLGGNCRTVMIAAISPSSLSYEDTYNTLNYANRAKNIKADLKRNVLSVDFHISQYAKIVDELRHEVTELKAKIKQYEDGSMAVPNQAVLTPVPNPDAERLKGELVVVFEDRRKIRKEIMEIEGSERDLTLKIHSKSRSLNRVKTICSDPITAKKVADRITHSMGLAKRHQNKMCIKKHKIQSRMDENESRLQRIQSEITALEKESLVGELLESQMRNHHLEIELLDTKRHVKCLKKLCRFEEAQAKNTENILTSLLQAYRKTFFILKGHGIATLDTVAEFESIRNQVEGEREVAWADQSSCNPGDELANQSVMDCSTTDDSFDINQILTFPVLSTVNLLTHTPRRSGSWTPKTPGSMFHGSPISCMKNRNATPLQPFSLGQNLANSLGNNSSVKCSSTKDMQPTIQKCTDDTPSGSKNVLSECTPPGFRGSGPPDLQRQGQMLQNEQSHSEVALDSCAQNKHTCTNKAIPSVAPNTTFTNDPLEGIVPLAASNGVNTTMDIDQPCMDFDRPSVVTYTPVSSATNLNATITITPQVPPRAPLLNTTLTKSSRGDAPAPPGVNKGTVTKASRPHLSSGTPHIHAQGGGTVTKNSQRSQVNSGTVTKNKSTSDENTPPEAITRSNIVRSMNFSDDPFPTPAGKLTFAEALKSPGAGLSKRAGSPQRSPLASRENLPSVNKHSGGKEVDSEIPLKQRKIRFSSKDNWERKQNADKKRQNTLGCDKPMTFNKSALRRSKSAMGRVEAKVGSSVAGAKPKYMQLTRSASMKRSGHRRSLSAEGNKRDSSGPKRVPISNSEIPQRTARSLFYSKSKSTSQLPRR